MMQNMDIIHTSWVDCQQYSVRDEEGIKKNQLEQLMEKLISRKGHTDFSPNKGTSNQPACGTMQLYGCNQNKEA